MPLARIGDHLRDASGKEYIIKKFLGEGVTAEVYKAACEDGTFAALKILRPSLPKEIARSFRNEIIVLSELASAQREKSFVNTPLILGTTAKGSSPEFIALEYISGQSLDDLIADTGGLVVQNRELDALKIAQQTLDVLRVLHGKHIRRSYTDFQLKNIWLVEDNPIRIKVMDWNHVSRQAREGESPIEAAADLIRFGAYFYYLLTGKGALQTGETEGALAYRAGERWQMISSKTRAILVKALNLVPNRRYQDAAAFLADIEQSIEFWEADVDDLFDDASLSIRYIPDLNAGRIDKEAVREYLTKTSEADYLLDMYTRRSSETRIVERMQQDLQRLTDGVSTRWGAGKLYYEEGTYSESIKLWQEEAQNLERLDLWRWAKLAVIARSMRKAYGTVKERLEEAIESLNKKEETDGSLLLNLEKEGIDSSAFSDLYAEAEAWAAFYQGKKMEGEEDWLGAAKAYEQTAVFLNSIQDETHLQLLTSPRVAWPYPTLPDQDALAEKVRVCEGRQRVNAEEDARIDEFRQDLSQIGQDDSLDTLTKTLRDWFLVEKNQPALLQAIAEEAEKQPLANATALLSAAMLWGKTTDRIQQLWREKQKEADDERRKEMEGEYRKRVEEEETAVLKAIQAGSYVAANFYIEQIHAVKGIIPLAISTAVQRQFDDAVKKGEGEEDDFYTAQKWLTILKQILPDEKYIENQRKIVKGMRQLFDGALRDKHINTAKKWLAFLQPMIPPIEHEKLTKKWQRELANQKQREIERKTRLLLQEAKALFSDGSLEDAARKCQDVQDSAEPIDDTAKQKQYKKEAGRLLSQIRKVKRPVRKSITVDDYLKRLSDSDLEEMGKDIEMKIKDLGNIGKKSKRRFLGSLFAVLLTSMIIIVVGLYPINSSQQSTQERVESIADNLDTTTTNTAAQINELQTGYDTLSSDIGLVTANQEDSAQQLEDINNVLLEDINNVLLDIEIQLNDISDRVASLESSRDIPSPSVPSVQPTRPPRPPRPPAPIYEEIGALITPTMNIDSGDESFIFLDTAYSFDIPAMQIEITDDAHFLEREDGSGYEVIGDGNRPFGTVRVQIRQDGIIIDEGIYPVTEGAFVEDAPQQLFLSWRDTAFKLLPPGLYELQILTQRDLEIEPTAAIGMPYEFEIYEPIGGQVYNPTAAEYPTRLRTSPTWNCGAACAKEELSELVQVVAYAVVPYDGNGGLPYALPITPTYRIPFMPDLSFDHPLTITSVTTPTLLSPEMGISLDNANEYTDPNTGIILIEGNGDAKFFLVRIPGTRAYFWLGETDMLEFYYPELRESLLSLPELVKPPVEPVESEN